MFGAGGKWLASSVTEGHIKKLRGAGYLPANIAHRLPAAGQIVPTPEPAWRPPTTFGLTLKIFSHRPKWGLMRRKASHTTINAEMLRMKFRARSWKSGP